MGRAAETNPAAGLQGYLTPLDRPHTIQRVVDKSGKDELMKAMAELAKPPRRGMLQAGGAP